MHIYNHIALCLLGKDEIYIYIYTLNVAIEATTDWSWNFRGPKVIMGIKYGLCYFTSTEEIATLWRLYFKVGGPGVSKR